MPLAERRTGYATASTTLALFSDQQLRELVDTAVPLGAGIGGTTARLDIDGVPVFVKSVSLTDLEQRPENVMSTTNLFELPAFCHYGIGSPGFGVWRELAAHVMTTAWVLDAERGESTESACAMVDENLRVGTSFMNSRGLLHLDAHFENILTDGERLYFTDFGLAMFSQFDLSDSESDFFQEHQSYDRCDTATHLVNYLVNGLLGYSLKDRDALLAECADGKEPLNLPQSAGAIIMRYAPIAVVMNEFFGKLQNEARTTPYPVEAIQRVCGTKGEPQS